MNFITKLTTVATLSLVPVVSFAYERIVILTPDVGDIIQALGSADKVVGRDDVNQNPIYKSVKTIGVHRNLTAEPIIAVKPDLVVGSYMAMPNSIYQRLTSLKIKNENIVPAETVSAYAQGIQKMGVYLNKKQKATNLLPLGKMACKPVLPPKFVIC